MATVFCGSRSVKITTADNGNTMEFGPAGTASNVGTWMFRFVPDATWTGSGLTVKSRPQGQEAKDNAVPFVPIPYQAVNISGAIPGTPYAYVSAAIATDCTIQVPDNGQSIGMSIVCTGGFGWLYSWDMNGVANAP